MSAYMSKILKASGQVPEAVKRVLEINPEHPVTAKMKALYEADREDPQLAIYSEMLLDLALVAEGGKLDDPARFSRQVGALLAGDELMVE